VVINGKEIVTEGRFIKIARLRDAWYDDVENPEALVNSINKYRIKCHIFTFFQRVPHTEPMFNYYMEPYGVAVIKIKSYEDWWNSIGKKTRYMIRKAQKSGIEIRVSNLDSKFVQGISDVYNETPIRQGKKFPHYRDSLEKVQKENGTFLERSLYLGAYHQDEFVGFMRIVVEKEFADVLQLLSKVAHRDKAINNALLAKSIDLCSKRNIEYLAYGDLGIGGLDEFKRHNGFSKMDLPRYFIPLNCIGRAAMRIGFHKNASNLLPVEFASTLKGLRRRWYKLIAN
jgi:hypothetical protein